MVKFVHTADWQLGMTRHFLSAQSQPRFTDARLDVIATIGRLAAEDNCDFVIVCGDVFESNQIDFGVVRRAFDQMRATPEIPFYLLPGNHDPLDPASIYLRDEFEAHRPDNVHVLSSSEPQEAAPGVELIPAPWHTKRPVSDLVADACKDLTNGPSLRIVVGHGMVDALSPNRDSTSLIALANIKEKIEDGVVHYIALGDRHSTTLVGNTERVWYSGAPEPTRYEEKDAGNALVVDLDVARCHVETRRVGHWRFIERRFEFAGDEDVDEMGRWLSQLTDKSRTVVKLSLIGSVNLLQKARIDTLISEYEDVLGAIEVGERRSALVVLPDEADLDLVSLSGYAQGALEELRTLAESSDEQLALAAQDAIGLLCRLAQS